MSESENPQKNFNSFRNKHPADTDPNQPLIIRANQGCQIDISPAEFVIFGILFCRLVKENLVWHIGIILALFRKSWVHELVASCAE